jgi:alpha-beta hydrolase superfamily lysophospholipase
MDQIAQRGFDVYLVDLPGYGKSTRPPEMDQPADANGPFVGLDVVVGAVGSAVDFILQRRNIARTNLIGWSWGTTIMANYTTQNAAKVQRLALYAPDLDRKSDGAERAEVSGLPHGATPGRL